MDVALTLIAVAVLTLLMIVSLIKLLGERSARKQPRPRPGAVRRRNSTRSRLPAVPKCVLGTPTAWRQRSSPRARLRLHRQEVAAIFATTVRIGSTISSEPMIRINVTAMKARRAECW